MKDKIIAIIQQTLEITDVNENITKDATPEWDSMKHLILISNLEDEFDIAIEPEEMVEMTSFSAIEQIITKATGN